MGLLVFLLAMPVVPITAIINAGRTRAHRDPMSRFKPFLQSLLVAFIALVVRLRYFSQCARRKSS